MTTKIPVELSSTPGIVDGSNATAITIDSSENVTLAANLEVSGADVTITSNIIHAGDGNTFFGFNDADTFRIVTGGSEGLRVNSSQNVGIGTSSPSSPLHVTSSTANTNGMVRLQNNMDNNYETLRIESLGDYDAHIGFFADGSANYYWGAGVDYSDAGKFKISNDNLLATNTRLTITTAGNVGIGTTSPDFDLVISDNGGYGFEFIPNDSSVNLILSYDRTNDLYRDYKVAANQLLFGYGQAAGNESMRIDSNGDVQIGTTSQISNAKVSIVEASTDAAIFIRKSDGTQSSTNTYIHFDISGGGTAGGKITFGSGGSPQFTATSDARLKENIKDVTGCLDKVMALKPSSFTLTESNLDVPYGFIAQNVETVLPEFVSNDENGYKQISEGLTIPYIAVLTKAIQEQQEQIEALQSEINNLKAK